MLGLITEDLNHLTTLVMTAQYILVYLFIDLCGHDRLLDSASCLRGWCGSLYLTLGDSVHHIGILKQLA
jgi:hypothetical protein